MHGYGLNPQLYMKCVLMVHWKIFVDISDNMDLQYLRWGLVVVFEPAIILSMSCFSA